MRTSELRATEQARAVTPRRPRTPPRAPDGQGWRGDLAAQIRGLFREEAGQKIFEERSGRK